MSRSSSPVLTSAARPEDPTTAGHPSPSADNAVSGRRRGPRRSIPASLARWTRRQPSRHKAVI